MMRVTRRGALAGALAGTLAVPAFGKGGDRRVGEADPVMVHDAALDVGRRIAAAGRAHGRSVLKLSGDRIRFARKVCAARPALVVGVSRHAHTLLMQEVAREEGYAHAALLREDAGGCAPLDCRQGWQAFEGQPGQQRVPGPKRLQVLPQVPEKCPFFSLLRASTNRSSDRPWHGCSHPFDAGVALVDEQT